MQFRLSFKENYESRLRDFLINDLDKFVAEAAMLSDTAAAVGDKTCQKCFEKVDVTPEAGLKDMPVILSKL